MFLLLGSNDHFLPLIDPLVSYTGPVYSFFLAMTQKSIGLGLTRKEQVNASVGNPLYCVYQLLYL